VVNYYCTICNQNCNSHKFLVQTEYICPKCISVLEIKDTKSKIGVIKNVIKIYLESESES
jgi:transcription initiation factor IIE alpha subunit